MFIIVVLCLLFFGSVAGSWHSISWIPAVAHEWHDGDKYSARIWLGTPLILFVYDGKNVSSCG